FVNNGAITSAGNLTVLAGGTLTNAPAGRVHAGPARVQAVGQLNLLAPTVVNHGVVSSTAGNVNVDEPSIGGTVAGTFAGGKLPAESSQNISINNASGTIKAQSGSIEIGDTGLGASSLLSLKKGNLVAPAINLLAGGGTIQANVNHVTGTVNFSGG